MKHVSVVVPVYNEIESLPLFWERIRPVFQSIPDCRFELIFVDDGSTDGSLRWIADLSREHAWVKCVSFSRNFGSYVALMAGVKHVTTDAAVLLSVDLQDPPELLPQLILKWQGGAEVVWAVRKSRAGDPLWKRVTSVMFYSIFRKWAFPNYPPKGYDFCLIDRIVIDMLSRSDERNTSIFALIVWANFRSAEVPYERGARQRGETHWSLRKMFRLAADLMVSFSSFPIRLSLLAAATVGACLFVYMAVVFYGKLSGELVFPPGWPSLMTVILLTSGLQLSVLAILGQYLLRTLEQTRGRPSYVVARRIGFEDSRSDAAATRE